MQNPYCLRTAAFKKKKKQYEKSNFYKIISHRNLDKNSEQGIENSSCAIYI